MEDYPMAAYDRSLREDYVKEFKQELKANRSSPSKIVDLGKGLAVWTIVLGSIGAGITAGVVNIVGWQRGIYAGFHYQNAKNIVGRQLVNQIGATETSTLTYRGQIKTHLYGDAGGPQVRIFRYSWPDGRRWCVWIWGGFDLNTRLDRNCSL